jgi:hypothetical protein
VAALRAMAAPVSAVTAPALATASSGGGAELSADPDTTRSAQARPPVSPRLAAACEIVMGLTMGYMLITML